MEPKSSNKDGRKGGPSPRRGDPPTSWEVTLDWFLHSLPASHRARHRASRTGDRPLRGITTLKADQHETLGFRLVAPAGFNPEALKKLEMTARWSTPAQCPRFGTPGPGKPSNGSESKPVTKPKATLEEAKNLGSGSRPFPDHKLGLAYGANVTMQRLRKREGQENRLESLRAAGKGKGPKPGTLRVKIERQGWLTQEDKEKITNGRTSRTREGRRSGKSGPTSKLRKGGGKLYRWAQRKQAGEQLTGLEIPEGEQDKTIAQRLETAKQAWKALWVGGKAWKIPGPGDIPPIQGDQVREC